MIDFLSINHFFYKIVRFFYDNFPTPATIFTAGPPGLLWAYICLYIAGRLKESGVKTGYTRKIFHFAIFITAAVIHYTYGFSHVCLFGGMASLIVLYALVRGPGHLLYEALAREKDAPYQTYYIVVPYFATLIGGILGNVFFGNNAIVGYLVAGIGDAIAEPVGTRYGKHRYQIPFSGKNDFTRSYEGSIAVFLTSLPAIWAAIHLLPHIPLNLQLVYIIPAIALICALVEAISPHGWDNVTMQIIPAFLFWSLW